MRGAIADLAAVLKKTILDDWIPGYLLDTRSAYSANSEDDV